MTATELRSFVENYEQYNNVYMNFKVDDAGVWGLPEGDKTQHLLTGERLEQYMEFLNNAIKHYETMNRFFNDYEHTKKYKKYQTYLKRLNNVLNKVA